MKKIIIDKRMRQIEKEKIKELGYEIIVQSGNKFVKFSELLNGNPEKSFGREIRQTHNWEKMLYSGCFDLDIPDWR